MAAGPDARSNNVKRLNDDDESLAQLALQKQQTTCFVPPIISSKGKNLLGCPNFQKSFQFSFEGTITVFENRRNRSHFVSITNFLEF